MSEVRRATRTVSHPILRLDVIGRDGSRQSTYRVFCKQKAEAVPLGLCASCVRCESIAGGTVTCGIAAEKAEPPPDPLGLRTPVGVVIREGAFAVMSETTLRDALSVLRAEDRRSVVVIDAAQAVIGIVHETQRYSALAEMAETAGARMSSRLSLRASTPVRRALELLAAAHLREVVVVDEDEVPLGLFRDIEGLRWLIVARDA